MLNVGKPRTSYIVGTHGDSSSLPSSPSSPSAGVVIHTTDAEAQAASMYGHDEEELEVAQRAIPAITTLKDLKMTPLEFEKV